MFLSLSFRILKDLHLHISIFRGDSQAFSHKLKEDRKNGKKKGRRAKREGGKRRKKMKRR
jgi:hypothetical protein